MCLKTALIAFALPTVTVHTMPNPLLFGASCDICRCLKRCRTPSHLLRKWWCHAHFLVGVMGATFLKRELSPPPPSHRECDYMPLL